MNNILYVPDKIPIVFASDDNYIPYMSTAIQSIIENSNQARDYLIYILHKGINEENITLLIEQIAPYKHFAIELINISDYINKYNFFVSGHITEESYYRLLIPYLFINYKKIIYLDCDMIVCTDISELYYINIENYLIAAMRDIDVINWYFGKGKTKNLKGYRNSLNILKNPENYFCAGLCIFNIELFQKLISQEKIFKLALSNNWDFHDQDILNILCEDKTLLLTYHWGFYSTNCIDYLPECYLNEYLDAEKNPKIIHYVYKPWNYNYYIYHFEYFWKYATRTPFINVIIKKMNVPKVFSFRNDIIDNIINRKGIGIKFILYDCVKAWICRKRKK